MLRRPGAVQGVCDDYRASAFVDDELDAEDQRNGRQLIMPVLAAWHDPGDTQLPFDPEKVWARRAPRLDSRVLPTGHFLPEEAPEDSADALHDLMRA